MPRVFQDDLPSVGVSRLRASGAVTAQTRRTTIGFGDVEVEVGLSLQRFSNGGSWSLFVAPCCGRRARTLRLLEGYVLCWRCCVSRGVRYRCEPLSVKQRAERRIPKLRAMLESKESLRLKRSTLWGTMERRSRLEARLRECEFRAVHGRTSGKTLVVDDPCNESDFQPPKPRPRSNVQVGGLVDRSCLFIPKRPASLAHLTNEAAARALSRHFGDIVEAAKELGVDRKDLRRLTWHNPRILDAAHERMSLFVHHMWGEAVCGLDSRVASVRQRAVDRMFAHPMTLGNPFASGLSLFAPAARARGPHRLVDGGGEAAADALEREAEAEQARELEREAAAERELERVEVMVERRPSAPTPASTASLWPSHIRRPTRGRRW